eukprot:Clim_evm76s243 gene=Clim_evmTU76s243
MQSGGYAQPPGAGQQAVPGLQPQRPTGTDQAPSAAAAAAGQSPVTLKVFRLARPSFRTEGSISLDPANPLEHSCGNTLWQSTAVAYEEMMAGEEKTLGANMPNTPENFLMLPSKIRKTFLGDSFVCLLSIVNDSPDRTLLLQIRVEIQVGSRRITKFDTGNAPVVLEPYPSPNSRFSRKLEHEVRDLGQHALRCAISYVDRPADQAVQGNIAHPLAGPAAPAPGQPQQAPPQQQQQQQHSYGSAPTTSEVPPPYSSFQQPGQQQEQTQQQQQQQQQQQLRWVPITRVFRFQVLNPLNVRTKTRADGVSSYYLEAQIENSTDGPLTLESATFENGPEYTAKQIGCPVGFSNDGNSDMSNVLGLLGRVLEPGAVTQLLFALKHVEHSTANDTTDASMTPGGTGDVAPPSAGTAATADKSNADFLGILSLNWKTHFGDGGRLRTNRLQRRVMQAGSTDLVSVSGKSAAQEVLLEELFQVAVTVTNITTQVINAELEWELKGLTAMEGPKDMAAMDQKQTNGQPGADHDGSSGAATLEMISTKESSVLQVSNSHPLGAAHMGLLPAEGEAVSVGRLQPLESRTVTVLAFAAAPGLQKIRGLTVVDKLTGRMQSLDIVGDVFVSYNHHE